jgi:hypothetical protein
MAAATYDNIVGSSAHTIQYTSATPGVVYPESSIYNVLGVAYVPRIYARDLTALELASSGRIAASLNDVFAFDLSETSNLVSFEARSNAGFQLRNGPGDAFINLQPDGTFQMFGSNDSAIRGNNLTVFGSNSLLMKGGDASLMLADDLTFAANSLGFNAASNLSFTACNQASITAGSNSLIMDGPTGDVTVFASSNVTMGASNGGPQFVLDATDRSVTTTATNVLTQVSDGVTVTASNDIVLSATDLFGYLTADVWIAANSNMSLNAADSNVSLALNAGDRSLQAAATGTVRLAATGSELNDAHILLSSDSNSVSVYAPSLINTVTDGTTSLATNLWDIAVGSNATVAVSNALDIRATQGSNRVTLDSSGANLSVAASVQMTAAQSNVSLRLDASSNSVALAATGDVAVHTDEIMTLSGKDSNVFVQLHSDSNTLQLFAPSNLLFGTAGLTDLNTNRLDIAVASNAVVGVSNDLSIATTGASNRIDMNTSGVTATIVGDLLVSAAASNIKLHMSATSNEVLLTSSGNVGVHTEATFALSASNSNSYLVMDDVAINMWSDETISQRTSLLAIETGAGFTLAASNYVRLDGATLTARMTDSALLNANSNLQLNAASSNVYLAFGAASNTVQLSATGDVAVHTDEIMTLSGKDSNVYVQLHSDSNSLTLHAPSNVSTITAGATRIATGTLGINAADTALVAASNDVTVGSAVGTLALSAAQSNVLLSLNHANSTLTGTATGGISLGSGANLSLTTSNHTHVFTGSNFSLAANGSNQRLQMTGSDMTLFAANQLSMQATTYSMEAASNYVFNVNGVEVLRLSSNNMTLRGNIDLTGSVNTIVTEETILQVQDKLIRVSYSSNGVLDGLLTNDGSGLQVVGAPAPFPSSSNDPKYAKSFTWNYGRGDSSNAGTLFLGTSNLDESYWQVRGGSLRLSVTKSDGSDLSFGFRINDFDELELVKYYTSNLTLQQKRVAKFGKQLA